MAITYLKRGKSDAERAQDDSRTRATVEATLKDIETRGDAAAGSAAGAFGDVAWAASTVSGDEPAVSTH